MRRTLAFLLVLLISVAWVPASRADGQPIESHRDGFFSSTEIQILSRTETGEKSGTVTSSKTYSHYNNSGVLQWTMKLTGTFSYNGTSATCTNASVSYTISNSNWHFDSKSENAVSNVAYGSLTMVRKVLFITVETITHNMTLTCDPNGNVS